MSFALLRYIAAIFCAALALPCFGYAQQPYAFNVLNQRSVALTAEYWNPILIYVSRKSGVPLELRLARTAREADALAERGAYQFLFTNHFFTPERDKLGFRVIARAAGPGIRAQIAVPRDSRVKRMEDLSGKEVAFANPDAFVGYWVPMDALLKRGVAVKAIFTPNQEAALARLELGSVAAAAVNDQVLQRYARRERMEYKVIWTSPQYRDLCIMAGPTVPAAEIAAVRDAFVGMLADPEGRKILQAGAKLLAIKQNIGFVAASDRDYDDYRSFYKSTLVKPVP